MVQEQPLDLERLVVSDERNDAEALALVLGLVDRCPDQRRDGERFRLVRLVGRAAVLHTMRDDVRLERRFARVAQRADLPAVAEMVAELDDLGNAAEVLGEADRASERL